MRKPLILTLKKKWFDMILSGEKKEEYRKIKAYWHSRLMKSFYDKDKNDFVDKLISPSVIIFKNGYSKNAATIEVECKGIYVGECNPDWSENAQGQHYIISLGEILSTKNIK